MIQNYSRYKLLREFFIFPRRDFQIRELCRLCGVTQPSVTNHLKVLLSERLITKEKKGIYPTFRANRDSDLFKHYKVFDLILQIRRSGFLDYLYDLCFPNSIVLFGSASRGEDIEESDIDIFVQAKSKRLDLKKYERLFNRRISVFFEENFLNFSSELKNNILNGIILRGYLKVF